MIKRMGYFPKYEVEANTFNESFAIISITDINSTAKIQGTNNILRLEFLDIEDPVKAGFDQEMIDEGIVFNDKMAQEVIAFIENVNKEPSINTLVIHCNMGVSRSAALSLCVAQYLEEKNLVKLDFEFQGKESAIYANKLVVSTFEKYLNNPVHIPTKEEAQEVSESIIVSVPKMFKPL